MKTIELNTLGFIQEIKEHKEFKSFMLNYILNNNFNSLNNVSITDWTDAKNPDREYVIEISKFLKTYLANVSRKLKALEIQVSNIWYIPIISGSYFDQQILAPAREISILPLDSENNFFSQSSIFCVRSRSS